MILKNWVQTLTDWGRCNKMWSWVSIASQEWQNNCDEGIICRCTKKFFDGTRSRRITHLKNWTRGGANDFQQQSKEALCSSVKELTNNSIKDLVVYGPFKGFHKQTSFISEWWRNESIRFCSWTYLCCSLRRSLLLQKLPPSSPSPWFAEHRDSNPAATVAFLLIAKWNSEGKVIPSD